MPFAVVVVDQLLHTHCCFGRQQHSAAIGPCSEQIVVVVAAWPKCLAEHHRTSMVAVMGRMVDWLAVVEGCEIREAAKTDSAVAAVDVVEVVRHSNDSVDLQGKTQIILNVQSKTICGHRNPENFLELDEFIRVTDSKKFCDLEHFLKRIKQALLKSCFEIWWSRLGRLRKN